MIRFVAALFAAFFVCAPAFAETPFERGRYLVNSVLNCGNCHTPKGPNLGPNLGPNADKLLSGGMRFDTPGYNVVAPNLTPDRETGLGRWSDADIKKALVQGVRPT